MNHTSFISSQAPGIKVYSKAARKVVLTIDTQEIGIRTFSLSSCGKFLGKMIEVLYFAIELIFHYLGVINDAGNCIIYKLNTAEDLSTYTSYDLVFQVNQVISLALLRDDLKVRKQ